MNPPASIQVMHLDFQLRFVDRDIAEQAGAYGWCNKQELIISVRNGLRPRLLCDTIIHEVTHACFFAAGMADDGLTEEQVASQLTGPMLCVIKDNPALVIWLQSLLNPEDIDDSAYV